MLNFPAAYMVYLRYGSAQPFVRAVTMRQALQIKLNCHLTQSQFTVTGPTIPGAGPITPGVGQVATREYHS